MSKKNLKLITVSKPDKYPDWATDDVIDVVSAKNNVVEPPAYKQTIGFSYRERANRQFFNFLFRYISKWIRYFDYYGTTVVATTVDLPAAPAANEGRLFYIQDISTLCYCDGTGYKKFTATPININ